MNSQEQEFSSIRLDEVSLSALNYQFSHVFATNAQDKSFSLCPLLLFGHEACGKRHLALEIAQSFKIGTILEFGLKDFLGCDGAPSQQQSPTKNSVPLELHLVQNLKKVFSVINNNLVANSDDSTEHSSMVLFRSIDQLFTFYNKNWNESIVSKTIFEGIESLNFKPCGNGSRRKLLLVFTSEHPNSLPHSFLKLFLRPIFVPLPSSTETEKFLCETFAEKMKSKEFDENQGELGEIIEAFKSLAPIIASSSTYCERKGICFKSLLSFVGALTNEFGFYLKNGKFLASCTAVENLPGNDTPTATEEATNYFPPKYHAKKNNALKKEVLTQKILETASRNFGFAASRTKDFRQQEQEFLEFSKLYAPPLNVNLLSTTIENSTPEKISSDLLSAKLERKLSLRRLSEPRISPQKSESRDFIGMRSAEPQSIADSPSFSNLLKNFENKSPFDAKNDEKSKKKRKRKQMKEENHDLDTSSSSIEQDLVVKTEKANSETNEENQAEYCEDNEYDEDLEYGSDENNVSDFSDSGDSKKPSKKSHSHQAKRKHARRNSKTEKPQKKKRKTSRVVDFDLKTEQNTDENGNFNCEDNSNTVTRKRTRIYSSFEGAIAFAILKSKGWEIRQKNTLEVDLDSDSKKKGGSIYDWDILWIGMKVIPNELLNLGKKTKKEIETEMQIKEEDEISSNTQQKERNVGINFARKFVKNHPRISRGINTWRKTRTTIDEEIFEIFFKEKEEDIEKCIWNSEKMENFMREHQEWSDEEEKSFIEQFRKRAENLTISEHNENALSKEEENHTISNNLEEGNLNLNFACSSPSVAEVLISLGLNQNNGNPNLNVGNENPILNVDDENSKLLMQE